MTPKFLNRIIGKLSSTAALATFKTLLSKIEAVNGKLNAVIAHVGSLEAALADAAEEFQRDPTVPSFTKLVQARQAHEMAVRCIQNDYSPLASGMTAALQNCDEGICTLKNALAAVKSSLERELDVVVSAERERLEGAGIGPGDNPAFDRLRGQIKALQDAVDECSNFRQDQTAGSPWQSHGAVLLVQLVAA